MDLVLTLLKQYFVIVCVCSPETGGLPPVKIEKKTDKEESRKVSKLEHVGGGRGGEGEEEEGSGGGGC